MAMTAQSFGMALHASTFSFAENCLGTLVILPAGPPEPRTACLLQNLDFFYVKTSHHRARLHYCCVLSVIGCLYVSTTITIKPY